MDNAPMQEEPHDIEAEKAVLGAAFLSKNALADAMEYLEPQDFYRKAHQIIFEKMVQLNDADQPIDPLTMKNVLDQEVPYVLPMCCMLQHPHSGQIWISKFQTDFRSSAMDKLIYFVLKRW